MEQVAAKIIPATYEVASEASFWLEWMTANVALGNDPVSWGIQLFLIGFNAVSTIKVH